MPRLSSGHFDPIYAYAGNNPIGGMDPTGELPMDGASTDAAIGAANLHGDCAQGDQQACDGLKTEAVVVAVGTTAAVGTTVAVESGAVEAVGEAALAVAKKGKAVATAAVAAVKKLAKDVTIDGPSEGAKYANGRLIQLRYKKQPVIRLDLHPLAGSNGKPVLHLNIGPGESKHIWIWPRKQR